MGEPVLSRLDVRHMKIRGVLMAVTGVGAAMSGWSLTAGDHRWLLFEITHFKEPRTGPEAEVKGSTVRMATIYT